MENKCIICDSFNTKLLYEKYPGYIEGSFFNIYKCKDCDSHFILTEKDEKYLYDIIYSSTNSVGYDRYYHYAEIIKEKKDPLQFLAYNESTYYPIYKYVKDKTELSILEIGCGYGYLSYSLKMKGHDIKALDISKSAINFAKKNFGDFFYNSDIITFANNNKERFDLIVSTEVIEHLNEPNIFLNTCVKLLKDQGKIILTTPNKDYYKKKSVWQTDLPPVHISWISKKGMLSIANKHNLRIIFTEFSNYYSKHENRIVKFLLTRKRKFKNPC